MASSIPDDDFDFDFDDSLFDAAAREILDAGGYDPKMLTGKNGSALIGETFRAFDEAIGSALGSKPDPAVAAALRENAFVFSGFKTHAELEQVAALITDEKGNIRPFNEFLDDVKQINQEYNHRYLRTEYNQAVQSAQMASKWADFERDKAHINLQYRTADDERVRASHRVLHGVTLPVDDEFWRHYFPPNGWGCRCTVIAVPKDDPDFPVQDFHGSKAEKETVFPTAASRIFRYNPGATRELFPPQHPYLPKGCGNCGKTLLAYNPRNPLCKACVAIEECKEKEMPTHAVRQWIEKNIQKVAGHKVCKTAITISYTPREIVSYASTHNIELGSQHLRISDEKILHALRDVKKERNAALTVEELSNISDILPKCDVYFDQEKDNFVYVYKNGNRMIKYVFQPKYKIKVDGKKETAIHFLTGGVIEDRNIPATWTQIKNSN